MGLETQVRIAAGAGASYIRPWPITAMGVLYPLAGLLLMGFGLVGAFTRSHYSLGELLLPAAVTRLFLVSFGAGLVYVGWGFLRLSRKAWTLFICAAWVGLVLEALWMILGLTAGAAGLRYLPLLVVDGGLLAYVHGRRNLFMN